MKHDERDDIDDEEEEMGAGMVQESDDAEPVIDIDAWRAADVVEAAMEAEQEAALREEMQKRTAELEKNAEVLSFWEFFSQMFVPHALPSLPLKAFHKDVCDVIERALTGATKKKFIIINIPPRSGKTKLLEAAACWQLAYFTDSQIIYTSYSAELAMTSVRFIMDTVSSEWYRQYFGDVLGKVQRADNFTTMAGGRVYSAGTGGTLTGLGAGLKRKCGGFICVDDPAKPGEAQSKVESQAVRDWFEMTLKSRRNSSIYTPIVICAQRLAVDDLPGYILANYKKEDIELIKIPALQNGRSIIPETITSADLMEWQRISPYTFASQYQQEPIIAGGNLFKIDAFNYYDADPSTMKWDNKVIVCDTAFKTKEWNDYTVLQCWGKSGNKAYIIDQVRGKWETPQLPGLIKTFWNKHNNEGSGWVRKLIIEEHASGTNLIQSLRQEGIPVTGVKREKDKTTRAKDVTQWIASGLVFLPKNARWVPGFLDEVGSFREDGKSAHDDQVDCLVDGLVEVMAKKLSIFDVLGTGKLSGWNPWRQ